MLTGATKRLPPGDAGPLLHAIRESMPRRTPTGRTYRALCGAGVYFRGEGFDEQHPRACRECARLAGR